MNKRNTSMTARMKEVLADERYKNPRLFTKTIYREDGTLIPEHNQEKLTEQQYFEQFVPKEEAKRLLRQLEFYEKYPHVEPPHYGNPIGRHVQSRDSEWADLMNWKTRKAHNTDTED